MYMIAFYDIAVKWLNPRTSLKEQGVKEEATLTLTLRKRLFFTQTLRHDLPYNGKELNLIYLQLQNAIINGVCPCTCEIAIELAALQCQIQYGNFNEDEHKPDFIDHEIDNLLPHKYVKVESIKLKILEAYRSHGLSASHGDARYQYIQLCTTLDGCGITFYIGKV